MLCDSDGFAIPFADDAAVIECGATDPAYGEPGAGRPGRTPCGSSRARPTRPGWRRTRCHPSLAAAHARNCATRDGEAPAQGEGVATSRRGQPPASSLMNLAHEAASLAGHPAKPGPGEV